MFTLMEEHTKTKSIASIGKEIGELSSRLKHLDAQKEQNYQEISKVSTALNELLRQASELKASKQELSKQIQNKKKDRDRFNAEVSKLASKLKATRPEGAMQRGRTLRPANMVLRIRGMLRHDSQQGIRGASAIRKQIEQLNMKLQTEVSSFKKEQGIMGQIKELRGKLKGLEKQELALKAHNDARAALRKSKQAADILHKEIQHAATNNSAIFVKLATVSKNIAGLKARKDHLRSEISTMKIQIGVLNKKLSGRLTSWSAVKGKMDAHRRAGVDKIHAKKAEVAHEKLKTKKKLTTEDILAMQRQGLGR